MVGALRNFAATTRSYFVVATVFGLIVAVFDVVALLIIGIPLALVWGVLSFITNYIPNVGFVLGLIPPALPGFLDGGWQVALWEIGRASGGERGEGRPAAAARRAGRARRPGCARGCDGAGR